MLPTLQRGDVIITDPSAYEDDTEPARGDVVIFQSVDGAFFVKRIIALAGEEVAMRDGTVFINGVPLTRSPSTADTWDGDGTLFEETLPGGQVIQTIDLRVGSPSDTIPPIVVPEGHFFMMGDNRDNSMDSRFVRVGAIPREKIFAKARRVIFSSTVSRIGVTVE